MMSRNALTIFPATLKQANDLVAELHRHHKPVVGHRFSIGVRGQDGIVHGAAIIGRPVGRKNPQYDWAEVTRLVTDGTHNACSKLYGAAARVCKEMGFRKIQTFILDSEGGRRFVPLVGHSTGIRMGAIGTCRLAAVAGPINRKCGSSDGRKTCPDVVSTRYCGHG